MGPGVGSVENRLRLLDRVRREIRLRHYSIRTEEAYVQWVRRFVLWHGKRHPEEMGAAEVSAFLSSLATEGRVSASTQNQALNALVFLYRKVLERPLPDLDRVVRARKSRRLPVVLSETEVQRVLLHLSGTPWLCAALMYGSGLRLLETVRLRIKDLDLDRGELAVRDGQVIERRSQFGVIRSQRLLLYLERALVEGLGFLELAC